MQNIIYENYEPTGDIITLAICFVLFCLINASYITKSKIFDIFKVNIIALMFSSVFSLIYHHLLNNLSANLIIPIYLTRGLHYLCLLIQLVLFNIYLIELGELPNKKIHYKFLIISGVLFGILEMVTPITKIGFYIDKDLNFYENYKMEMFRFFYCFYFTIILFYLIKYRKRFIASVVNCLLKISVISFVVMTIQSLFYQTSYVCATFLFPIITVLFLVHYKPYDINSGTLDVNSFKSYIKNLNDNKFIMIFLYLEDFSKKDEIFKTLRIDYYNFYKKYFKNYYLFNLNENLMVLVCKNLDIENISDLFYQFDIFYKKFNINYKLNVISSNIKINNIKDYIFFNKYINDKIKMNVKYISTQKDYEDFIKINYIIKELEDIKNKNDLNDERVLVYCQPVFNTYTNKFDSEESLMRLNLQDIGLIQPNLFIPIAEKYDYIHILSKIILNKTCINLKKLLTNNYEIDRISINFSIQEVKDDNFCDDIINIIKENNIPYHKIAIELTESKNTKDFELVKNKIKILKQYGIKFYLDDFGTGYSNFERIMELPIDVIKFDMSMITLLNKNNGYEYMINNFANIFKTLGYDILFEGVEDKKDELSCKKMYANYLQGYLYSKPIPIMDLPKYLKQNNN